jgi:DNA (cytosine-5)-methyltransferase 1
MGDELYAECTSCTWSSDACLSAEFWTSQRVEIIDVPDQVYKPQPATRPINAVPDEDIRFIVVDLFCGAGGTTTGFAQAEINGKSIAKVIACVNHDPMAIKSHWANHPDVVHFEEDIRTLNLNPLAELVQWYRRKYPNALVILWASLECTNFSKAKGGQPRDADSRTLANSLYMQWSSDEKYIDGDSYIQMIKPDIIQIENVVEFKDWGPTDENGKVIKERKGEDWKQWCSEISAFGYTDKWTELNSADFGAYTSRNRLFGMFAKSGISISFPIPTHSKQATGGVSIDGLKKWMPVYEVLDFEDMGESIITRKKKLAERTIIGIIRGIKKFVIPGDKYFLYHYYGKSCQTSISQPCSTFRTKQSAFLVQAFLHNPSWGQKQVHSIEQPCPVYVARQDKAPLRVVTAQRADCKIEFTSDFPTHYAELISLMNEHGISDIWFRPVRTSEALVIQGFPSTYTLEGTQADQQWFIGNSVVPKVVKVWTETLAGDINIHQSFKVA